MAESDHSAASKQGQSLLPFDPKDLMAMRVRPADFARMSSVSKQTVSRWIKLGTINIGPDGLLDPVKAARQVLERTNPARLRARVFKLASATNEELHERIKVLEARISDLEGPERAWRDSCLAQQFRDDQALQISAFFDAVHGRFREIVQAYESGRSSFDDIFDEIVVSVFYGGELDGDSSGSSCNEAEKSSAFVAADEAETKQLQGIQ